MADGEIENTISSSLNTGSGTGAAVEVKFEKNPIHTQKYLEAEPKALGVTQIMLSLFVMSIVFCTPLEEQMYFMTFKSSLCSLTSIVAGSVAIAAQNLHLPTLKACLGMQIVVCVLSAFCFMSSLSLLGLYMYTTACWEDYHNTTLGNDMCDRLWNIIEHVIGIEMLMYLTQFAISATLAGFCCKVIQCCTVRNSVPVIMLNAPRGPQ
ncbi:uncharacterized protein LOC124386838 [Silurus meridionalis]|uniref:Membrane-spanning 4-domains subfamily A member 4A-like n=1 Tax=Silurus meridionalis TaxID=175797 RepID=A0A8T0BGY5_SILME|nr:uncharacterized protein LOC124386838 [Silurus meridionalis]KAF7706274.1 hypothetical protein HF521_019528 [Silurus meridionalis]